MNEKIKYALEIAKKDVSLVNAVERAESLFAQGHSPEAVVFKLRDQAACLSGGGVNPIVRAASIALAQVAAIIDLA